MPGGSIRSLSITEKRRRKDDELCDLHRWSILPSRIPTKWRRGRRRITAYVSLLLASITMMNSLVEKIYLRIFVNKDTSKHLLQRLTLSPSSNRQGKFLPCHERTRKQAYDLFLSLDLYTSFFSLSLVLDWCRRRKRCRRREKEGEGRRQRKKTSSPSSPASPSSSSSSSALLLDVARLPYLFELAEPFLACKRSTLVFSSSIDNGIPLQVTSLNKNRRDTEKKKKMTEHRQG